MIASRRNIPFMMLCVLIAFFVGCSSGPGADSDGPAGDDDDDDASDDDVGDDDDDSDYIPPDGLEIVIFDVGQGDAILVRFPGGSTMLVDGGPNQAGDSVILPFFQTLHLDRLDYLVSTHPDADHSGGLDDVVEAVVVGEVWENGLEKDTMTWDEFSVAVDERGIPRYTVERGDEENIDGCRILVMNADQGWADHNANSVVLFIACEEVAVMLTGDATETTQDDLIDHYGDELEADLVKVPHHGSPDHASQFPTYVLAEYAVISCGEGNPYGHPAPEVVFEWEATGAQIFRTDLHGDVTVRAKDGALSVATEF